MQHYQTMKTNIGGTKSFANRTYNQQFQGTFKKLRHLFAITPKQGDLYTLKFDQPLYNDNKLTLKLSDIQFNYLHLLLDQLIDKNIKLPLFFEIVNLFISKIISKKKISENMKVNIMDNDINNYLTDSKKFIAWIFS
jgi:hypothetical protein